MIEILWLIAMLAGLAVWTVRGNRQYAAFKHAENESRRIAFYRRWTVESFLLLTGASLITLLMLGRSDAPFAMPDLFASLAARLPKHDPAPSSDGGALDFAIGVALALGAVAAVQIYRLRRVVDAITADIEPLFPRSPRERIAVVPLCLNAGFSEELFFRLALPLLVADVTGSAAIGFGVALAAFGLMHAYQGWKGVVGTTLVGALLTFHYLEHGALLWLMGVHTAIDLVALLVRPWIAGRMVGRRAMAA